MDDLNKLPAFIGRYRISRTLGHGAMGRVLLAQDPVLDREVAIKMLRSDLGISEQARQGLLRRMRHEAKAVARVAHPNIVTLHDMLDDPVLGLCLVFEYVSGTTIKSCISDGPMRPLQVARIAREVSSALSVAHDAGVLHRDVKPENIMLAPYGAKITDFGIAKVPNSTLTRTGGLLGTPAYSAPETMAGKSFSPASDQFSLAATLYEAISAQRAFPGDDAVTVAGCIATSEPEPIAAQFGLDFKVDQVLARGLNKDPAQRFATCEAFGEALAAALEIGTIHGRGGSHLLHLHEPPQRPIGLWTSVALGGMAVGALVGIVFVYVMRPNPDTFDVVASRFDAAPPQSIEPVVTAVSTAPVTDSKTKTKTKDIMTPGDVDAATADVGLSVELPPDLSTVSQTDASTTSSIAAPVSLNAPDAGRHDGGNLDAAASSSHNLVETNP